MTSRFFASLLFVAAASMLPVASAQAQVGSQPAQPIGEPVTPGRTMPERPPTDRPPTDRPATDRPIPGTGDGLDSTGPAQPRGLAPDAPRQGVEPAECRGLPRDARQACMEGTRQSRPQAPLPGTSDAPGRVDERGAPGLPPARPGTGNR